MSSSNNDESTFAAAVAATHLATGKEGLSIGSGYVPRVNSGARGQPGKRRREVTGAADEEWDRSDPPQTGRKSQSSRSGGASRGSSQAGASGGSGPGRATQAGKTGASWQDSVAVDAARAADGGSRATDVGSSDGGEGAGRAAAASRAEGGVCADSGPSSSSASSDNDSEMHDNDLDHGDDDAAPSAHVRGAAARSMSPVVTAAGGFDALCFSHGVRGVRGTASSQQLREVTQEAVEWLFGVQRAGLLRLSSSVRSTASKEWLQNDAMARRLAKTGASVPTFATAPVHYYAFQWQCADLLRDAQVDIDKAAEWAHASGRWFLSTPNDHSSRPDFALVQTLARSLLANLEVAQAQFIDSPNPSFSHTLHRDAVGLMRRFFTVRGAYVVGLVRKALRSPILPSAHRPHIRTLGLAYRGMATEFQDFLPRLIDNLDSEARAHGSFADAERFTGDAWLRFFQAFCRGILGGSCKTGRLPTSAFSGVPLTPTSMSPPMSSPTSALLPPYCPPPPAPGPTDPASLTAYGTSSSAFSIWSTGGQRVPAADVDSDQGP